MLRRRIQVGVGTEGQVSIISQLALARYATVMKNIARQSYRRSFSGIVEKGCVKQTDILLHEMSTLNMHLGSND